MLVIRQARGYKCKSCGKALANQVRLRYHQAAEHAPKGAKDIRTMKDVRTMWDVPRYTGMSAKSDWASGGGSGRSNGHCGQ